MGDPQLGVYSSLSNLAEHGIWSWCFWPLPAPLVLNYFPLSIHSSKQTGWHRR